MWVVKPAPSPAFLPQLPSLPVHQGIRARDQLYQHLDEAIAEKLPEEQRAEPRDALHLIINSARELGQELSVQELKVGDGRPLLSPLTLLPQKPHTHSPSPVISCLTPL